jgi:hypothetical protein
MNKDIEYLLSAKAVRDRTKKIYDLTLAGKTHFEIDLEQLVPVAKYVLEVIHDNYPDLKIPFHSRWGHFKAGGIDRAYEFNKLIKNEDKIEQARKNLDLVITSVLLDAGAGPQWKYIEDTKTFNRSEGLGVASYHMFLSKVFSNNDEYIANSEGLKSIHTKDVEKYFQVDDKNPLIGCEGRANLLKSLGEVCSNKSLFKDQRPGNVIDHMINKYGNKFKATDLLHEVLVLFGPIWPSRINIDGVNLGDVWHHPLLGEKENLESLVPIHKLSQWLTYSLIEPIMDAGIEVSDVDKMTGLAEYRNGGLLIDLELLKLKDPNNYNIAHKPDSEIIIEWRSLTVQLLDQIAAIVQKELGYTASEFPLAKVLEGGTWWAGRKIAKNKRDDSTPPLKLDSDGTVF